MSTVHTPIPSHLDMDRIISALDPEAIRSLTPPMEAVADLIDHLRAKDIPTEDIQALIQGMVVASAWMKTAARQSVGEGRS